MPETKTDLIRARKPQPPLTPEQRLRHRDNQRASRAKRAAAPAFATAEDVGAIFREACQMPPRPVRQGEFTSLAICMRAAALALVAVLLFTVPADASVAKRLPEIAGGASIAIDALSIRTTAAAAIKAARAARHATAKAAKATAKTLKGKKTP